MINVRRYLEKEISRQTIPGVVLSISKKDRTLLREAFGYATYYPVKEKMTTQTRFDLASLTKVVVTLPLILRLMDKQFLHLDTKISRFFPSFQEDKHPITVEHLLTHTSGFQAHYPFYEGGEGQTVVDQMGAMALVHQPGKRVIYSDLNFMLLQHIVENVTKTDFVTFANEQLFRPLSMNATSFNPIDGHFASTEWDNATKRYLNGIVHDENARFLGGVSGHAGLFSTIEDLEKYARMIEGNGKVGEKSIISESVVRDSKRCRTEGLNERRGLGWIMKDHGYASCGADFTSFSYGHTGFTGTSMWFDPLDGLRVILLTNRVHFGRENREISRIRAELHDLIKEETNGM
ncbi:MULTISPECIES: serine hydrolase domain-containing protein [Shouchella]|uniref:Serine hydrolase n=2 Tax=Shouchella TaxID=2893057 RepID=A0ABY7WA71_9BACI|nr:MULTISPECIES: serine hydrolase domain-containing protein [Shouchella]MED4126590.1 serine hydrolase [Shouchella miscanthi]WDF04707.1 serine hydrolase [Shouchella hunanensis]